MTRKMSKVKSYERWGATMVYEREGQSAEGVLMAIKDVKTEHGETSILCLEDDDGVKTSVFLTSALAHHQWDDYIGRYVIITYTGEEKNPKTKRTYKAFCVEVEEVEGTEAIPF